MYAVLLQKLFRSTDDFMLVLYDHDMITIVGLGFEETERLFTVPVIAHLKRGQWIVYLIPVP